MTANEWIDAWYRLRIIFGDKTEPLIDASRRNEFYKHFQHFTVEDVMSGIDAATPHLKGYRSIPDASELLEYVRPMKARRLERERLATQPAPSVNLEAMRFELICGKVVNSLLRIRFIGDARPWETILTTTGKDGKSIIDLLVDAQQYQHPCNETPGAFVAMWETFPAVQQALAERLTASEVA